VNGLSTPLAGAAGEYAVAAMLSRLGCAASITPRNADRTDVLAQHVQSGAIAAIQVKTSTGAPRFRMSAKEEYPGRNTEWVIGVHLANGDAWGDFYVVPRSVVSALLYLDHRRHLAVPGKNGQPHADSTMRLLRIDDVRVYRGSWPLLDCSGEPEHGFVFTQGRFPMWAYEAHKHFPLSDEHPCSLVLRDGPPVEKVPECARDDEILAQLASLRSG
jgi:hypothetical protein